MRKTTCSARQKRAVQLLLHPDFTGDTKALCRTVGVTEATLMRWMEDEDFRRQLKLAAGHYADVSLPAIIRRLVDRCMQGESGAIKLYFELLSRIRQQPAASAAAVVIAGEDEIAE